MCLMVYCCYDSQLEEVVFEVIKCKCCVGIFDLWWRVWLLMFFIIWCQLVQCYMFRNEILMLIKGILIKIYDCNIINEDNSICYGELLLKYFFYYVVKMIQI